MTNEELLKDYLEYALPDINGDGVHTYLDKQTLERVVVDDAMIDKAKVEVENTIKEEDFVISNLKTFPERELKRIYKDCGVTNEEVIKMVKGYNK